MPEAIVTIKGGSENRPCNQCGCRDREHCSNFQRCAFYTVWLNACWEDFRRFYKKYGGEHD